MRPYGVRWRPRLTMWLAGPIRPTWADAGAARASTAAKRKGPGPFRLRERGRMAPDGSLPRSPMPAPLTRLGLVVHPTRDLEPALGALRDWTAAHGVELVQLHTNIDERRLVARGEPGDVDVIVALGGDGTVLAALRLGAQADKPVLGIACGSLGALAAVRTDRVADALDRVAAGACKTLA